MEAESKATSTEARICSLKEKNKELLLRLKELTRSYAKTKGQISLVENRLVTGAASEITTQKPIPNSAYADDKLQDYLNSLSLPDTLFNICKDPEQAMSYLMKQGLIPQSQECKNCGTVLNLAYNGYRGYSFRCERCNRNMLNAISYGFWGHTYQGVQKLLLFIFLWIQNVKDASIGCLLDLSVGQVVSMSRKLRKLTVQDFLQKFTPLDGVVEIALLDFIKRKIEIGKSKRKEKWVLIMIERHSKEMYMEYVKNKNPETIRNIILKRVRVGSILITDEWAFENFEDFGYPHYKIDYSRGFSDSHKKSLHTCNVITTWTWVRQQIKLKNRLACQLQEYLCEWMWRRKIKMRCKGRQYDHTNELIQETMTLIRQNPIL